MLNILPIAYLHDNFKLSFNYTKLKTMDNERLDLFAVITACMFILLLFSLLLIAVSITEIRHDVKIAIDKTQSICKTDTTFSVIQNSKPVVGYKVPTLNESGQNNVVVKTWPTGNKSAYCK